ncbi:hypothetical protein D3C79_749260 [compost metagenome]
MGMTHMLFEGGGLHGCCRINERLPESCKVTRAGAYLAAGEGAKCILRVGTGDARSCRMGLITAIRCAQCQVLTVYQGRCMRSANRSICGTSRLAASTAKQRPSA